MLFNSYAFLLVYLPITVIGFFIVARRNQTLAALWLGIASVAFYGWWDYHYIPLLLGSVVFNFWCGRRICECAMPRRKQWLVFAVVVDLVLLAYYKYADFFLTSANQIFGAKLIPLGVILPIGISFFTFTQIAFLVDSYQGKVKEYRFVHYLLFVTYFPHLIAGPVLHHKEMMPQFADPRNYRLHGANFAIGLSIFCIGLAKKVLLADSLAPYANALFSAPDSPSLLVAWGGVLAYAFQLYFDFSGYSDMAIGLSRLFGVQLPLNFNSPYKATNISDFWRRWHMTLSRFLREYLYIALGGNRKGRVRRYANLIMTMLLGGLWHGAGWNFVIWGGLHGIYLVIHNAWSTLTKRLGAPVESLAWKSMAVLGTFVAVCFAWVFFRAPDLPSSLTIIKGMTGSFGVGLPQAIGNQLGGLRPALEGIGMTFFLGGGTQFFETWTWVAAAALIAFTCPNTQEILGSFTPALELHSAHLPKGWLAETLRWTPTRSWAIALGTLLVLSLLSLNRPSQFLYFQF